MKISRQMLALMLTFVMVLSMGTVVSAAEMTASKQAEKLGLLQGDENGVTDDYLAKQPTRLQAAIISLRLQGLEEEALTSAGSATFIDANEVAWDGGKRILSYLKSTPSAGWAGYPDGTFKPYTLLTSQAYVKVMLEALGYKQGVDFEWAEVFAFAKTKGLSDLNSDTVMTNEQLAVGSIDALGAVNSSGKILLDVLIDSGKIDFDDAVAAGLKEPMPDTIEVVSVEAPNLKQLVVTFNMAIEDAGDEEDYTIIEDHGSDAAIDEDSDFSLSNNGRVVTITLTEPAEQQDSIDLEIDHVVDEKQTFEEVEFLDLTIPEVTGAEAVGVDTIKVMFSEPMQPTTLEDKNNFTVEDQDSDVLYIRSITAGANDMSVLIELYSDVEDDVTVEVAGVKDYQGYMVLSDTVKVYIPYDQKAPVVVDYKDASTRKVTLVFDSEIEMKDDSLDNFYHTNKNNETSSVTLEGDELTLIFPEGSEMPEGTVYIYVEEGSVNDLWDNENNLIVEPIKVVVDKTPAEVVGSVEIMDQESIEITYDKDIMLGDDFDITVIAYGDAPDVTADGEVKSSSDSDVLVIEFSEPITGKYAVIIEGVEDEFGNETPKETLTFYMEDETAPVGTDFSAKLYNADADIQLVKVDFNDEEMMIASITDKELYFAGGVSLDDPEVDFDVINNGKSVEIEIPEDLVDLESGDKIVVGRVKDAAGNAMTSLSVELTLDGTGTVAVEEVRLVAADTIEVQIKDDTLVAYDPDEFEFSGLGEDRHSDDIVISRVNSTTNTDDETVIIFTLSNDRVTTDTSGLTYTIGSNAGENDYGESIAAGSGNIVDEAAPEVAYNGIELTAADTMITITFTEDLDEDLFSPSGMNGFSVSGGDAELDSVDVSGNSIVLNGSEFTIDTNVYYNDAFGLADEDGNEMDDISYTDELE